MAIYTYETTGEEHHSCDYCGVTFVDGELERCHVGITITKGDGVCFEWWSKGEYCYRCRDDLFNAVTEHLPIPERHDRVFRNDDTEKAIEIALIKRSKGGA